MAAPHPGQNERLARDAETLEMDEWQDPRLVPATLLLLDESSHVVADAARDSYRRKANSRSRRYVANACLLQPGGAGIRTLEGPSRSLTVSRLGYRAGEPGRRRR
jgi:hypothetical protein